MNTLQSFEGPAEDDHVTYAPIIAEQPKELQEFAAGVLEAYVKLYEDETETPEQNQTSFRRYLQFRIDERKAVSR